MKFSAVRFLKSAARWARNRRPPVPPGEIRIAGVLPTRNYRDTCSTIDTLSEMTDASFVLDDRPERPFPQADRLTELLSMRHRTPWNATGNTTMLMYRAFLAGFEWVVSLDDDVIPSAELSSRAAITSLIERMKRDKLDMLYVPLRDLWGSDDHYRTDGIWGRKMFPMIRRNWFFYPELTFTEPAMRLHSGAFPSSLRRRWRLIENGSIYHIGCLTPDLRRQRVEKYRLEDPENRFQNNYTYMLDETGLTTAAVPPADLAIIRKKLHLDRLSTA